MIIRPSTVGAEEQGERVLVVVRSRGEKVYPEIPDVIQIAGNEIAGEGTGQHTGSSRTELILEPRLRLHFVRRCAGAECRGNIVECFGEDLARLLVLEEEGIRVEVVTLIKLAT